MEAKRSSQPFDSIRFTMLRHPLFGVAAAFASGILTGYLLGGDVRWLCPAAIGIALLALLWTRVRHPLLWFLLPLAGWVNLAVRVAPLSPYDLRTLIGTNAEIATLRGVLVEAPVYRVYENDDAPSWRTLARVRVSAIQRREQWAPAQGVVAIKTPGKLGADYFSGQPVEVMGILQPPQGPVAEGLFDYRSHLQTQGVYYELKTSALDDWRLMAEARLRKPPLPDRFIAWAQRTLARGLPEEDEALRLTWAMALGWKTALTGEVAEPFMQSGTMHIFAISGLHVALIAGILVSLLRFARVSRGWCGAVVLPLLWIYTAATGWQASAIRSTIMMSVVIGGWSLHRPANLTNSLGAAVFLILVWEPRQLFQAGFQLSVLVVLAMAVLIPRLEPLQSWLLAADPLLPPELLPPWRRRLNPILRFLTASFATSLAAAFGSMPLIAHYFHLVTPVSVIANLVIVPLSGLALTCNLGSLLCGDWLPATTELFNHSGWFFMRCMAGASVWFSHLPGAYWYVPAPGWWGFIVYYGIVAILFSGRLWLPGNRRAAWIIFIALLAVGAGRWMHRQSETRITILNAGCGDAIFMDLPGSRNDLLIDSGDAATGQFVVRPFLQGQGINHLSTMAITHGDIRHVGGAAELMEQFQVARVATSKVAFRSPLYRELMNELERTPGRRLSLQVGDQLGPWRALHPAPGDRFSRADDNALVLMGEFSGFRVLLCSDLGRPGQRALFDRGADLRADIVVAGVPTGGEPLNDALLDRIQPRLIILSCGHYPATEIASRELRERLERRGVPILYTDRDGSVSLTFRNAECWFNSMQGMQSRLAAIPANPILKSGISTNDPSPP